MRNEKGSKVLLDIIDIEVSLEALTEDIIRPSEENSHATSLVTFRERINALVFECVNKGLLVIKCNSNKLSRRVERQRFDRLITLVKNLCLLQLKLIDRPHQPHKSFCSPHNKSISMFRMRSQCSYFLPFYVSN